MTDTDVASLLRFFKALAHESRLRLLGFAAQRERSVQELAGLLGLSEPTTSHHLALLHQTGLVILRVEGNLHWYAFEPSKLAPLAKSVLSHKRLLVGPAQPEQKRPTVSSKIIWNQMVAFA